MFYATQFGIVKSRLITTKEKNNEIIDIDIEIETPQTEIIRKMKEHPLSVEKCVKKKKIAEFQEKEEREKI